MKVKKNLTIIATVLILSIVATGCGNSANDKDGENEISPIAGSISESPEEIVLTESIVQISTGEKKVTHMYGETIIPAEPQRIVCVGLMDLTLATEIPLVAITTYYNYHLNTLIENREIPKLDMSEHDETVNLEQVLSYEPDLIIANVESDAYEQLSKIAPTVAYDTGINKEDFFIVMRNIGAITNSAKTVESAITDYEVFMSEAAKQLQEFMGDSSIAMLRVKGKELRLYPETGNDMSAFLYDELGLNAEELVIKQSTSETKAISLEILPTLKSDYVMFLPGYSATNEAGGEEQVFTDEILNNPLFKQMPANLAGQVYSVEPEVWGNGGVLAIMEKTQNLLDMLMK